jgi:hypothetical protein
MESKKWTLGMSETGDKFHLISCDGGSYKPFCQVHAKNMKPISESEVSGNVRICTNCVTTGEPQNLLGGIEASRYSIKFTRPSEFKKHHPTTED